MLFIQHQRNGKDDECCAVCQKTDFPIGIPEKEGIYTIVYEAYDAYGNCGRKRIDVTAVDFVGEPQISFVQETPSSAQAGQELILPECEVTYANGATEISRQAVRGEEIFLIEGDSFVPQEEGEYTIEYIAKNCTDNGAAVGTAADIASPAQPAADKSIGNTAAKWNNRYRLFMIYGYKVGFSDVFR